jgi:hypothetical protein
MKENNKKPSLSKLAKLRMRCFRFIRYRKRSSIVGSAKNLYYGQHIHYPVVPVKTSVIIGEEVMRMSSDFGQGQLDFYSQDSYIFFKHFVLFLKYFLQDFFSIFFKKSFFFFLFLKIKFKVNFFIFYCLKKKFIEKRNLNNCRNFTGSLKSFIILEIYNLDLHFGFFTNSFFFSYQTEKLFFFYRRNFFLFNLNDFLELKINMDYWVHLMYNDYIACMVYFFPKLRHSLCHKYQYFFFENKPITFKFIIFKHFSYSLLILENYLINLFFCKYVFFSLAKENVLSYFSNVDPSFIAFSGSEVFFLWDLLLKLDVYECISVIWESFKLYFFINIFFFLQNSPKIFYFTKLTFHNFMNLVLLALAHQSIIDEVYDEIISHFENKWLSINLSKHIFLNSSFFSMFFIKLERHFENIFLDKFLYFLPISFFEKFSFREAVVNSSSYAFLDYTLFLYGEQGYVQEFGGSFRNLSLALFDSWKFEGYDFFNFSNFLLRFFWQITGFGFLSNFFVYSTTYSLVLDQIFIDNFFLQRFISSLGFLRFNLFFLPKKNKLKGSDDSVQNTFKLANFIFFYFLRDIFFKLLKSNEDFLLYFFFSLDEKLLLKFSVFFLKNDFLKVREFVLLQYYPNFCKNFFFKKMYCNKKFIK